jgi:beta-lactamase regulating signal transducer with metallopeptidase domain/ketosteroid isomerase-like protein
MLAVLALPLWPSLFPKSALPEQQPWKRTALSYAAELPRMVIVPAADARLPVASYKAGSAAPIKDWVSRILPGAFCLWIAGALIVLFRSLRGYRRLRRASRHGAPTTAEELGIALELPQSVSLSLSAEVRSPVLLGLRHPVILLPQDLADWTSVEEREAMIAHELAHVARLDHWTNLLPLVLKVIFFFHPLVRYACQQFCLEREMACDDRVIDHGADAVLYAESLVKAAERSVKGKLDDLASHSLHQPAFFTSKQALERRIEMVLNTDRVRVLARGWRYLILPAVLILTLAGLLVPDRRAAAQQLQKGLDKTAALVKNTNLSVPVQKSETANCLACHISAHGPTGELVTFKHSEHLQQSLKCSDCHSSTMLKQSEFLLKTAELKRQDSGKDWNGHDDPPPPPQPSKTTLTPQYLNDAVAAGEMLQGDQSDTNLVKALIHDSVDAYFKRDIAFIERTMADDFQGIGIFGEVVSKGEVIAEIKHPRIKITKFEIDDLRLKGEGNSMIATYIGTAYYEEDGQEKIVRLRYTDNLVKRQGSWQWIGSHVSLMR